MTMTIKIENLGPHPYVAEVRRGSEVIAQLGQGQSVEVVGWKGDAAGKISIVELPRTDSRAER